MVHSVLEIKPWGITNMVQQRSRQESLADEAQREKNKKNKKNKDFIDRLKKFLEKNQKGQYEFKGMEPFRPPSWFKRINPETLPDNLEKRYKNLENYLAKKKINKKRAISDKDIGKAKGGKIKVYAKGGGIRKVNH